MTVAEQSRQEDYIFFYRNKLMNVSLIKDSLDQRQKRITEADFLQLISELFRSRLKK